MKEGIHPESHDTTITCTCGAVYNTRSTVKNIRIGICAACHPFFTGEQRFIDTAGRVDKFAQRYGSTSISTRREAPKNAPQPPKQKAPPKEKKPYTPKPVEAAPAEEAAPAVEAEGVPVNA